MPRGTVQDWRPDRGTGFILDEAGRLPGFLRRSGSARPAPRRDSGRNARRVDRDQETAAPRARNVAGPEPSPRISRSLHHLRLLSERGGPLLPAPTGPTCPTRFPCRAPSRYSSVRCRWASGIPACNWTSICSHARTSRPRRTLSPTCSRRAATRHCCRTFLSRGGRTLLPQQE